MQVVRRQAWRDVLVVMDETAPERRRARAWTRVAPDPVARRLLTEQQRVRAALQGMPIAAPAAVRSQVERARSESVPTGTRRRYALATGLACVAIALAAALAIVVPTTPSVNAIASIVHQQATEAAPAPAENGRLLDRSFAGIEFPRWSEQFGWHAIGARHGHVGDRSVDTVFYFHEGHRVSYTIVSGAPLAPPADARPITAGAATVYLGRDDAGHTVVTFEREGHTCVLSGHVLRDSTLVKLASWTGQGAVEF